MSIHRQINISVYPCYKKMIDFLLIEREKEICDDLKVVINLNIILNTACYIEGFLDKYFFN